MSALLSNSGHSETEGQEEANAVLLVRADEGSLDVGSEERCRPGTSRPPCAPSLLGSSLLGSPGPSAASRTTVVGSWLCWEQLPSPTAEWQKLLALSLTLAPRRTRTLRSGCGGHHALLANKHIMRMELSSLTTYEIILRIKQSVSWALRSILVLRTQEC